MRSLVIIHVDCDAFFAAVEQRDHPALRGRPVIVGADPCGGQGRGVVSTCSYEARRFGIHSAMPISLAYRRCPQAVFLRGQYAKYQAASDEIFAVLQDYTPQIEPMSIDEAFLDVSGSCHFFSSPYALAQDLKRAILRRVGLTVSVGIAPVKFVAKIASDQCKPDGLLEIPKERVLSFLRPLDVSRLWGVGPKTQALLSGIGIRTIGDLAAAQPEKLKDVLGGNGLHLYALAHGVDPRPVCPREEVKSVSHEYTFLRDTGDFPRMKAVLLDLSEKVSRRLRQNDLKGRAVSLKIRLKGFRTYTRAKTLNDRTNFADVIFKQALNLFEDFYRPGMEIRLLGVRLTQFEDAYARESLFVDPDQVKKEEIHRALDRIKDKYGEGAIHRGRSVEVSACRLKGA